MKTYHIWFICLILISCHKEDFNSSGMVEDHFFLKNDKQNMPVVVAGNMDSRKMLVVIHGGPGGNALDYRNSYVKTIVESDVAIVYWDQRYSGQSQGNGGSYHITTFREDLRKLLQLLKAKYGQDKEIFLFAHSWGGFIAPYFLSDPQNLALVKGWIQIGGAHNYRMNDSLTREMLIFYAQEELDKERNKEDWYEILEWCNNNGFEGRENAGQLNQFAHKAEGLIEAVNEPNFDFSEIHANNQAFLTNYFNMINSAIKAVDEPTYSTPITDVLHKISCPTLLLWGKYDFVCPPELAIDIEKNIGSSDVTKIIFNASGHSPMVNEERLFWNEVKKWVGER